MIRVAVIGCGYWGPKLLRNFFSIESCRVVALADLDPQKLSSISPRYPGVDLCTDPSEVFKRKDVDAVAIATPISTHYHLALEALEHGKHVLVEKPMTSKADEGKHLVEVAHNKGLTLMVDHTFLYTSAVKKIKEMINNNELGDIYYFDSVRVNLGLFQHDVNVIWDLAPHDFSIMCYLVEEEPVSVQAVGACHIKYSDPPLENMAYVTINFDSGLIAHFHVNWLTPVKVRKILIGGSKKMLIYDDIQPDEKVKVYDKGVCVKSQEESYKILLQYRTGDAYVPMISQYEPLNLECRHFLECIETGKRPLTDGESGIQLVKLLEAADLSLKNEGRKIKYH
ncbi:MAG TPA: Gfo/Idh/MocA family oxidoreductase [Deltaproteobacteria bacterium]|nr:Gfo/Idh/MocA family oxidoreductase [Deltaproteobacteria bacterium]